MKPRDLAFYALVGALVGALLFIALTQPVDARHNRVGPPTVLRHGQTHVVLIERGQEDDWCIDYRPGRFVDRLVVQARHIDNCRR